MKATADIQKGDRITFSKTEPILPTLLRRQELIQNYYFSCCCLRCSDASELDSHFSSLQCPKCKKGTVLSENPLGKSIFDEFQLRLILVSDRFCI